MDKLFNTTILTKEGPVFQGEVASLVAPGEIGYLGVLANHAPLATSLVPGKVILRDSAGKITAFKSAGNGFLEVLKNEVLVLLDSVEPRHSV